MKPNILTLIIGTIALCACNKQEINTQIFSDEAIVKLSFSDTPGTKLAATTASNEKNIQNVQVYVFRNTGAADDGTLDIALSKGFDTPINDNDGAYSHDDLRFKCPTGPKTIYVVVNDSQDRTSIIDTEVKLLAQTHELKDASPNKILMIGKLDKDLAAGEQALSIAVQRMAAAIVLNSISNDFDAVAYQSDDIFRLKKVYLYNVAAQIDFAGTRLAASLDPTKWYNKASLDTDASCLVLTSDLIEDNPATAGIDERMLAYGAAKKYTTTHTFYSYANECAFSSAPAWNHRAAILVVEAEIKQGASYQSYYYPIKIEPSGGIQANKKYVVDLVIHRPGSTDPNQPVEFATCAPTITVSDWTTVALNEGNPFEI